MGDKIFQGIFYICVGLAIYSLIYIDNGTQFFIWWIICIFGGFILLGLLGLMCEKLNDKFPSKQPKNQPKDSSIKTEDEGKSISNSPKPTLPKTKSININKNNVYTPTVLHIEEKPKTLTKETKKKINYEEGSYLSLSKEQKSALLRFTIALCYCSPERNYILKEQYEILVKYVKILGLEECQLQKYVQNKWSGPVSSDDYIDVIKTIHQDEPFIQLINTCNRLLDLIDSLSFEQQQTESYAYLVFPQLLKEIGYTEEDIKQIWQGKAVYRFKKESNTIVSKDTQPKLSDSIEESFPVSKEQMAIFKKNWTLIQFRKEFGIERRIESRKSKNGNYKICIFIRNPDSKITEVGFSNSLGYPPIEEIQKREKELMVGLTKYGNYKLYDNKIAVITNEQPVDLGI